MEKHFHLDVSCAIGQGNKNGNDAQTDDRAVSILQMLSWLRFDVSVRILCWLTFPGHFCLWVYETGSSTPSTISGLYWYAKRLNPATRKPAEGLFPL